MSSRLSQKTWRMTRLWWIRTKVRGYEGKIVTFNPNRWQRQKYNLVYRGIERNGVRQKVKKIIELKCRKFGTTTCWAIDTLDECAYGKPYYQAVTMAHTTQKSQEIFSDIVKFAWDNVGGPKLDRNSRKLIRPAEKYNNKAVIDLSVSRGSKYTVTNDAKSITPNRLHISEAAYFEHDETIMEAVNALPDEALAIAESTANGMGQWFEIVFNEAWAAFQNGEQHEWYPIFHPWFADPNNRVLSTEGLQLRYESEAREIQEKYGLTDEQIFWWDAKKQTNRDLVYQFYPSCPEEAFIHSGRPVFDQVVVATMKGKHAREPLRVEDGIDIFMEPDDGKTYGIGVDTAEGLEHGDNSSITVICRETGEEAAQCTGKIAPHKLAEKIGTIARLYREHMCVIERNNHGHAVIADAKKDEAINLYQREVTDKVTEETSFVIGWDTNERSKAYAINLLARGLEDGHCVPHSPHTYQELTYYVHGDRGRMGAMPGKHDDRVISLSLANLACERMVILGSLSLADYNIY